MIAVFAPPAGSLEDRVLASLSPEGWDRGDPVPADDMTRAQFRTALSRLAKRGMVQRTGRRWRKT